MPFFPVDDHFAFCDKAVLAGNAAIGLWARAGSDCMLHATDGIVRREKLAGLGTMGQAKKLVEVRLWHDHGHDCVRCPQPPKGSWIFHDWTDVGTIKTAADIKDRREAGRERQRRHRSRQKERVSNGVTDAVTNAGGNGVSHAPPVPVPRPSSGVTPVSPVTQVPPDLGLTEIEIDRIKLRLGCDFPHAVRVAALVLSRASGDVRDRFRYVQRAIDDDPGSYRPTPTAGPASEHCPIHPGRPATACGGCAADARAVD